MDKLKVYKSCVMLEGGVYIGSDYLLHCCMRHGVNGGHANIGKFDGDEFPVEMIVNSRKKYIYEINNNITNECSGCPFIEEKDWDSNGFLFDKISITDFTECNLRCEYCFTTSNNFSTKKEPINCKIY